MVEALSFTGDAATLRARAGELADQGVTEIVYQPAGPDLRRELETFIEAVRA
jgi:5,10-methylenetetrahydromethanopterin reductase